jgi:hypothetical protein
MARWFCLCLIFILLLIDGIKMDELTDTNELFQRHIGAARDNRHRIQQRKTPHIQNQQQPVVPPDLQARWMELLNKKIKTM